MPKFSLMDHADDAESEGNIWHNHVGVDLSPRGNSMVPQQDKDPQAADPVDVDHDKPMEMDIGTAAADNGSAGASFDKGLTLSAAVGASEDTSSSPSSTRPTSPATSAPAPAPAGGLIAMQAGERRIDEWVPSHVAEVTQSETPSKGTTLHNGDSQTTGEATAISTDATRYPAEAAESEANGSPCQLFAEQSSVEQGQEMSVDNDDNDDDDDEEGDEDEILSEKASSYDAQSDSDAFLPLHDDNVSSHLSDERAPLENTYGPFINPTDTCLDDARERLHVALEQTRLLGASFTEQAYERYRCVMKPVPESLEDIIEPILTDPDQSVAELLEQTNAMKVEKDMEKRQAQQAGVSLEDIAYFSEGLHLVVLPEDEVDESDLEIAQLTHRGPTNPETGERVEEISASAAATTEQVFDRIRRIRAMRMGGDFNEAGIQPEAAATHLKRNLSHDHQIVNESYPSEFAAASYLSSSSAQSVDSITGDNNQRSKGSLQHLLTLAPDAEGVRPDGSFTAVRSALLARGVGMHEMKHDFRINPIHQRMLHPNYFLPASSNRFLPTLLGPNQLHRLKAADARREGVEFPSGARASIRSVVEEIFAAAGGSGMESAGKFANEGGGKIDDSRCGGFGEGNFGLRKALHEEQSAFEVGLFRQMHSKMPKSHTVQTSSTSNSSDLDWRKNDLGEKKMRHVSEEGDVDPILAFSVMNAVGLVRNKPNDEKNQAPAPSHTSETGEAQALGLGSVSAIESVSKFFNTFSASNDPGSDGTMNDSKTNTSSQNGDNHDEVCLIRGGGGQDELSTTVPPTIGGDIGGMEDDPTLRNAINHRQTVIAAVASPTHYSQNPSSIHHHHSALSAQQLTLPNGSDMSSLQCDLQDFYSQNGVARNFPTACVKALEHYPQPFASLGIIPNQTDVTVVEQETVIAIIPDIHQNAATAAAARGETSPHDALYGTALSSINPQNPFDFVASSPFQVLSNKTQSISSLSAFHAHQPMHTTTATIHQKEKPLGLLENTSSIVRTKDTNRLEAVVAEIECPVVAPSPQRTVDMTDSTLNGPPKRTVSHCEDFIPEHSFAIPAPPEGLHQDVANLIALAKFHDAHSLSRRKSDQSDALLVKFLLSLSAAIPIYKEFIADRLVRQLGSAYYQLRLKQFVGCSSSATASRNVIVAVISIWLWVEHKDSCERTIVESGEEDPNFIWLICLAVDLSLSALAKYFDSLPTWNKDCPANDSLNQQVAVITSESLSKQVAVDHRADASLTILDELLSLLDTLRTDALRAKTQERVLLASFAARFGNMTEAFSNAYVSSVVRAGVALGHENVCELGQVEECRASTLMPFDYFHDNMGIWEEPCRPITGYRTALGGDELKKQAHARSLIQKSMMRLQHRHGLKGGITDGGPYNVVLPPVSTSSAPPTPTGAPAIVRTPSGSLKRRGTYDSGGVGTGEQDTTFNPDHIVAPMLFNAKDVENFPYGQHQLDLIAAGSFARENKRRKHDHPDGIRGGEATSLASRFRSTHELEWDDVANMFFHGGNTRGVDINYDFSSNDQLGKQNIFAPFVRAFDRFSIKPDMDTVPESELDEVMGDEAILQRHRDALHEMKLKLDAALESRKQGSQQRGRRR